MAWFIGQSTIVILLAFTLGLVVGWLLWARRVRQLTVEVAAARIRAAGRATALWPYGRTRSWSPSVSDAPLARPRAMDAGRRSDEVTGSSGARRIPSPRAERFEIAGRAWASEGDDGIDDVYDLAVDGDLDSDLDTEFDGPRCPTELRGLERLRDLFGPGGSTAGKRPRTPEPRHTEAEAMPAGEIDHDDREGDAGEIDGGFASERGEADSERGRDDATAGGSSDDTTIAVAGLSIVAGEDRPADATAATPGPESDSPGRDALGVNDELALVEAVAAKAAVDDLTRVNGIGPRVAAALVVAGIRTYDQLAAAADGAIAAALRASNIRPTSGIRAWRALARWLADGDKNGLGDRRAGNVGVGDAAGVPHVDQVSDNGGAVEPRGPVDPATADDRPDPAARSGTVDPGPIDPGHAGRPRRRDATTNTRTNGYRAADGDNAPDGGGEARAGGDHGTNERGLNSEPGHPSRLPARRAPAGAVRRSVPPDALDPDDLARIEGIGPRFAAALVACGFRTFQQLADAGEPALRKAIGNPRPNVAPSLPTWPAQARLLAAGDENGFAELTAALIAGRRVEDNLERIHGVGPHIRAALRAAGINTFRVLANSDGPRLRAALTSAGLRLPPRLPTWSSQARLLADGDEEGFAELYPRRGGGRDERRR